MKRIIVLNVRAASVIIFGSELQD